MFRREQSVRSATHAGSWYADDPKILSKQLNGWLEAARLMDIAPSSGRLSAIVVPHAGYSYSGATAAYAFSQMCQLKPKRLFVLGPSHRGYLETCALPFCTVEWETPFGSLPIDQEVLMELKACTDKEAPLETIHRNWERDEHSLEMQLPYAYHCLLNCRTEALDDYRPSLIPITVGVLDERREKAYGRLLAPYLADPQNFFIISSDFCHWGERFNYFHLPNAPSEEDSPLPIHEAIAKLDHEAMRLISARNADGFRAYLKQTGNTICGRHPISVLLRALEHLHDSNQVSSTLRFAHYAQSNRAKSFRDSSVSYAAGLVHLGPFKCEV